MNKEHLKRNAIHLALEGTRGAAAGQSGGVPDVPRDFAWPRFDAGEGPEALTFLAQLNCAALAPLDPEGLLPHEGLLSFFRLLPGTGDCQGYAPWNAGWARVFWFPDPAALAPAAAPGGLRLPLRFLRGWREEELPGAREWTLLDLPKEDCPPRRSPYSGWQLLGWPQDGKGLVQKCEMVHQGLDLEEDVPQEAWDAARKAPLDWLPLLQLTSRAWTELKPADRGTMYFFIRREDLAARRFDQAWLLDAPDYWEDPSNWC